MTRFNAQNGAFSMTFTYDSSVTYPTVIFQSKEYFYPNGSTVLVFNQDGIVLSKNQMVLQPRDYFVNDWEL